MYSCSLNNMGFNYAGPFIHGFFSMNTCNILICSWDSMETGLTMYWSTLFYIQDLNIHGFYFILLSIYMDFSIYRGCWNQPFMDIKGQLSFWCVKSYMWISKCGMSVPLTPSLFKGQLCNINTFFVNKNISVHI